MPSADGSTSPGQSDSFGPSMGARGGAQFAFGEGTDYGIPGSSYPRACPGVRPLRCRDPPRAGRAAMNHGEIVERMLVPPGKPVKLKDFDPDWLLTEAMESLGKERAKEQ